MKIIPIVLFLGVIALVAGSMAVVNSEFGNTMDKCFNSSYTLNTTGTGAHTGGSYCNAGRSQMGSAGKDGLNVSDQYYTVVKGQETIQTISEQQGTIAIIAVMVIIILALVGVFAYVGMRRM